MSSTTDVAIIGAGPYGLSIAAHLRESGAAFRIFGQPMQNWRARMPQGMHLKSDGFASNLYDPQRRFTLAKYCADNGIAYGDLGKPVPVEVFSAYGLAFQKQLVPSLEQHLVSRLERSAGGFTLTLDDGRSLRASRVVVATGISNYEYLPEQLQSLPPDLCSHTAENHDLTRHKGREVLVLGRGASSTDVASLLLAHAASVQIVSREPVIFHLPPSKNGRSIWERLRNPNFGLGPSFRSAVYTLLPGVYHFLPERLRQRIVRRHLGPAAVWFIREQLVANVAMHSGWQLQNAEPRNGRVLVRFAGAGDRRFDVEVDHIIAGTGYRVDLARLPFMDEKLRAEVHIEGNYPKLSLHFESTVPGLYFVGLASAAAFGPLTRFGLGAGYTARKLSAHLRQRASRKTAELASATS
ncbi:MAG TPA: NAD(P)-binding domain-containing protein [Steroidobacteraceae bacterium]|nr:NAD(P)-binding domain-containing protein [Steroidobacteraceae bacterium]